jgi:hypothetical protein
MNVYGLEIKNKMVGLFSEWVGLSIYSILGGTAWWSMVE